MLESFEEWRLEQNLVHSSNFVGPEDFAFAADGPWDLRFFLHGECARKGIVKAAYFDKWVNIKTLFADFYRTRRHSSHAWPPCAACCVRYERLLRDPSLCLRLPTAAVRGPPQLQDTQDVANPGHALRRAATLWHR